MSLLFLTKMETDTSASKILTRFQNLFYNVFFVKCFRSEMKSAMKKMHENFSEAEIDQVIATADLDDDGEINFHEFCVLMTQQ